MRKLLLAIISTTIITHSATAQILFTYGGHPVSKQEFLRNYEKNNINKKVDYSEAAIREYLDLYTLYKMKVKEADLQHLDTIPAIQRELDNYRSQLAKNYLTDKQVNERLLKEAYERSKEDRHVAHILLSVPPNMSPEDTLKLFNRADSIYRAASKKNADFAALAKIYSDDAGAKVNGGDIGYITALRTLYSFENAVYNTKPGNIAAPFRTQIGYHIVKVIDKRPARGEIQVAQILFTTPESKGEEGEKAAKKKAENIYAQLKNGADFETMVREHSEDNFSVNKGGVMEKFGVGKTVLAFEDAAFALKNPGDIAPPVKTAYGYHIIKLIKKYPIQPLDSVRSQLSNQIELDARSKMARDAYFEKVKQKNNFKEYPANLVAVINEFKGLTDTGKAAGNFAPEDYSKMKAPLFSLANNTYKQSDFIKFLGMMTRGRLIGDRKRIINDVYDMYVTKVVNDYQEHQLEDEYPEFKNLMTEYRDGIMLFELMNRNVWQKASDDSTGLKKFYNAHKSKYQWEPGFEGDIFKFSNEEKLKIGQAILAKNPKISNEDLIKEVNGEAGQGGVTIQTGRFEFSKFTDASPSQLIKGTTTKPVKNEDGTYTVIRTNEVHKEPGQKSLEDARGYVVAGYQDYLEKEWNAQLRAKYPVKVEEKVLDSMVK